jgi:carbonic anhydrase
MSTSFINDTCKNATAPVNISMDNITGPCSLKCDYNYNYGIYSPNITNNNEYLSLNYSGKLNPVKYNGENYNVTDIRIYNPSLHTYNHNTNADGEIFIIHNGPGKNLIVSIPFIVGAKSDKGSSQLTAILAEAILRTPNNTESITASIGDFSLDNFIPAKKGYFSYNGTLPYNPCNGTYQYIVYNIDNALNININTLNNFKKIITSNIGLPTKSNSIFYNKNGANSKGNDDNIYIDCQPVNEDGEILVQEGPNGANTNTSTMGPTVTMEKIEPFLYVFIGIIVAYGIVSGGKYIFKKLRKE